MTIKPHIYVHQKQLLDFNNSYTVDVLTATSLLPNRNLTANPLLPNCNLTATVVLGYFWAVL